MRWAIIAQSVPRGRFWGQLVQRLVKFSEGPRRSAPGGHDRGDAALIGFFAFVIMRVTSRDEHAVHRPLHRGLLRHHQGARAPAIPYELRDDGAVIMVPKDDVTRLRMDLAGRQPARAAASATRSSTRATPARPTNFVQNINHLRALEGELARTIRSIDRVQAARVHLVIPERRLFERRRRKPSRLDRAEGRAASSSRSQVRAIRHLVASAVDGLKPRARLDRRRARPAAGRRRRTTDAGAAGRPTNASAAFEKRMRKQVEDIVASVVGQGRARVQVSAELDFNRVTRPRTSFDPESKVVRSTQTAGRSQPRRPATTGRSPSATSCPARSAAAATPRRRSDQTKKSEETINYEISKTTKTEVDRGRRASRSSPSPCWSTAVYAKDDSRRARLSAAAPRKSSTASPRWCARPSASTRSAATRSRSSTCASPRRRRRSAAGADRPARHAAVHQGRHHVRDRARRDDAARSCVVLFVVVRPLLKRDPRRRVDRPRSPAARRAGR